MTVKILQGDCLSVLEFLADESVHCVVTSPPYWGLRDYGVEGQLGLEATYQEHIAKMVEVFREVRRVLRKDGTLWLNYGDCYATSPPGNKPGTSKASSGLSNSAENLERRRAEYFRGRDYAGLKPKDLAMLPNRLAIALQEDGWWVRSEIIWHKPNPMPESIKDRPGTCHEKIFLLSKSPKYFYDAEAVMVDASPNTHARLAQDVAAQIGSARANGGRKTNGNMKAVIKSPKVADPGRGIRNNQSFVDACCPPVLKRNLRNVWTISPKGFKGAHFATFPTALVEPCIKAGCPAGGVVLDPFGGSGTVGVVAQSLGRDVILIELNPAYIEIARKRLADEPLSPIDDKQSQHGRRVAGFNERYFGK